MDFMVNRIRDENGNYLDFKSTNMIGFKNNAFRMKTHQITWLLLSERCKTFYAKEKKNVFLCNDAAFGKY